MLGLERSGISGKAPVRGGCATRRRSQYLGLEASRRGELPATSKRSTWSDVEEWRSIATEDDPNLRPFPVAVNLNAMHRHVVVSGRGDRPRAAIPSPLIRAWRFSGGVRPNLVSGSLLWWREDCTNAIPSLTVGANCVRRARFAPQC